ncbi:lactate utilization protein [Elioraea sp.]|uniref:LutC/YkgG family protein n=1 Tax=Elioraea sp. TaxID=2185103 RepID=UPI00307F1F17
MEQGIDARARILGRIRRGLRRGPLPDSLAAGLVARLGTHPRNLVPARGRTPPAERAARFAAELEKEHGTVARAASEAEIPGLIAAYLAQHNLPAALRVAPDPLLERLPWADRPMLKVAFGRAEPADAVSVTSCFAAVAETGTMLMLSGPDHPTTLNILPDTHIVVLRTSRVVGAYEDAFDLIRAERGTAGATPTGTRFMPRNVMMITGPSRSADIEQTLELGAHGPRRVHVILLEDGAG